LSFIWGRKVDWLCTECREIIPFQKSLTLISHSVYLSKYIFKVWSSSFCRKFSHLGMVCMECNLCLQLWGETLHFAPPIPWVWCWELAASRISAQQLPTRADNCRLIFCNPLLYTWFLALQQLYTKHIFFLMPNICLILLSAQAWTHGWNHLKGMTDSCDHMDSRLTLCWMIELGQVTYRHECAFVEFIG
jgi:hypothetical protein